MTQSNFDLDTIGYAVETVRFGDIVPFETNPRVITDDAVDKVAASILRFGYRQLIVIDDENKIVVGHTRKAALMKLGVGDDEMIAVHRMSGVDAAKIRAYRLADNRVAQETSWLDQMLAGELVAVQEGLAAGSGDPAFEAMGFDDGDFDRLFDGKEPEEKAEKPKHYARCPECDHLFEVKKTVGGGDDDVLV
jgi:hypothetical protein